MERLTAYFAYGTTQRGFAHYRRLAPLLGEAVARVRTVSSHAVVVPRRAACSNPGCPYVHRMAVLVPGFAPLRAQGDLFLIGPEALAAVDRLETGFEGPYVRAPIDVVSLDGMLVRTAQAYVARDGARWQALVMRGQADALAAYPPEFASSEAYKDCCVRAPGHAPPHNVVEP